MTGEFNGVVLLGVLWFLLSLLTRGKRKPPEPSFPRQPRLQPTQPRVPGDATQREGLRLETMLRDLGRALEEAAQPAGIPDDPLDLRAELGRSESLEVESEVRSLEGLVEREVRRRVDLDDEAAEVESRRIQAAASRDAPRSRQAKPAARQAAQQQPAEHTAGRTYTAQQLRDAVVWREILGPPVSMRGDG